MWWQAEVLNLGELFQSCGSGMLVPRSKLSKGVFSVHNTHDQVCVV